MIIVAHFFRILFKIKAIGRYHFAFYKKLFKPYHLFRGIKAKAVYDGSFKMKVELDEWIQQHIFFFGVYDESGISFIKKQLKPDHIFLDVGANIGTYSLSASACLQKSEGGMVYSFEPVRHIFGIFKNNIELNNIENIVPSRLAVFEENTTLELYVSSLENLGMSSMFHHDTESGEVERVEAIKMDDFLSKNQIGRVDLVKIDIEGAELFALRGMQATLQKFRPTLLMEISESVLGENSASSTEIFNMMDEYGYSAHTIDPAGDLLPFVPGSDTQATNFVFVPG